MLTDLRSILFHLLFGIATAIFSLLILLSWPFPLAAREAVARAWCRFVLITLRVVCGVRYRVEGPENLPRGPAVILSKHQSTWETIAYRPIFPVQLSWVIKKSLFRIPFYGWALKALEEIGIDRDAGREALRQIERYGSQHIAAGRWVVIFPEGTRTPWGEPGRYAQGGARLACAAGVPVVPVAVDSGRCWPIKDWRRYPGTITVAIGPPIETTGRSPAEVTRMTRDWIEGRMEQLVAAADDLRRA
ncbi:MAG: lysophospholipid acyltransferase family protein [Halofilum sp. (in: g-proteobacteria)]|nr:lysophospholipid acyltransferase family protein [Halofilum sp. (in: g-proteobacteria)]